MLNGRTKKPDIIIGTCLYNRNDKWMNYLVNLMDNTKVDYHIYLMNNTDELSPKPVINPCLCSSKYFNEHITIIDSYNVGLNGYSIPTEIARILDIPIMLCNDDVLFPKDWDVKILNENITIVNREGKDVPITFESIGMIGVTYKNAGCMKHQEYDPNLKGYYQYDFCVGHAQLITKSALRKGFTFDTKILGTGNIYGPYDIYTSQWMQQNELNIVVNKEICLDFPESKESHFHSGDPDRFRTKLDPMWKSVQKNIENWQKKHIEKWGYNRWYFN